MRLLDLFCGAGGCSEGYRRAGFEVVGVDIKPQPRYPFAFVQDNAVGVLDSIIGGDPDWDEHFDAIHASPPCQKYSAMRKGRWQDREHVDLVEPVRQRLEQIGLPYVIENVNGAPLKKTLILCGTMFGLGTSAGSQLRRHRLFEVPWFFDLSPQCRHNDGSAIGVYGGGQHPARKIPATIGVWGHAGGSSARDGLVQFDTAARKEAMGIDWMTGDELSQAIPPAYTEYIGKQLLAHLALDSSPLRS